jgi:HAE1 family hydrophobic/amphiphilic exporter-1
MLGFIILVGTVVNNAILIVHQALNHMREEGMPKEAAVAEAAGNRIRPIFMSVGTSVFGMLPLILFPGAGSEIYRGLGSVVVGGLTVSTIFTLFVVPALFSLTLDARAAVAARLRALASPGRRAADTPGAAGAD